MVKRRGQSIMLTEAGTRLVAAARRWRWKSRQPNATLPRLASKPGGTLRIALECHTCFDWLMPIMDTFRGHWPEIELDLVSGFHSDRCAARDGRADLS